MTIIELCKLTDIPIEVQMKMEGFVKEIDFESIEKELNEMFEPDTWSKSIEDLKRKLEPDEDGIKILTCQFSCLLKTYSFYRNMGIDNKIFYETMKFFSRFLKEYKKNHGVYKYVWAFWAVRQISFREFRIGELEYEMIKQNEENVISIHIPSDANLTKENLRNSYLMARRFFESFFPDYSEVHMMCNSWLLAPALKELLPKNSRILQFQNSFIIESVEEDNLGFLDWIYASKEIPFENLPEDTTLQRNLKQYLLGGGKVGRARGRLIENPFI